MLRYLFVALAERPPVLGAHANPVPGGVRRFNAINQNWKPAEQEEDEDVRVF